jgi:hypothetical protein
MTKANVPRRKSLPYGDEPCKAEPDCANKIYAKGVCEMHLARLKRIGSYVLPIRVPKGCGIDECNNPFYGNDLCRYHYDKGRLRPGKDKEREAERVRHQGKVRRAREKGAIGEHSEEEWLLVLEEFEGKCAYCGEDADTRDHVIPLTKGGSDFIENIVPACRSCNSSKQNKYLAEWYGFIEVR